MCPSSVLRRAVLGLGLAALAGCMESATHREVPGPTGDSRDPGEGGGCIVNDTGAVIFSEVMFDPHAAAAPSGQFIELYNTSDEALLLRGWTIQDGAGGTSSVELPSDRALQPHAYLLLAFSEDPAANGQLPVDKVLDGVTLDSRRLTLSSGGVTIDDLDASGVEWVGPRGASFNLPPSRLDSVLNDQPESWCASIDTYGWGDLGTPGQSNIECANAPICGDGVTGSPEQCDDGQNEDEQDGCKYNCRFSCADPRTDCGDTAGDCHVPICVNSALGQTCGTRIDDTDVPTDTNPCTAGQCAAGIPRSTDRVDGTPCDNGGGQDGDYCRQAQCVEPLCGDGVRGPREECDDENTDDGDGCSGACLWEECGNARVDYDEDCDDGKNGNDLDGCRNDCHFSCSVAEVDCADVPGDCAQPICVVGGMGRICGQSLAVEDVPIDGNPCTADVCDISGNGSNPRLPDGTICDNASGPVGDYCVTGVCIDPVCNDGILGSEESCDDGNHNPCDGCLATCALHTNFCGDGYVCPPEQCDDGNTDNGDGCAATCQREPNSCGADMVAIPADPTLGVGSPFCLDRYEASRIDASSSTQGTSTSLALSRPGVIPWYTDNYAGESMTTTVFNQYEAACQNAGKRLCTETEWFFACTGTARQTYVFGNGFDRETCNCVDTFCDDYCAAHPEVTNCDIGYNCGYTYDSFQVLPTGQLTGCVGEFGAHDVCGNVWEVVPSTDDTYGRIFEIRGGAFNCAYPDVRLQCTYNAGWSALFAGFRCCKDLE